MKKLQKRFLCAALAFAMALLLGAPFGVFANIPRQTQIDPFHICNYEHIPGPLEHRSPTCTTAGWRHDGTQCLVCGSIVTDPTPIPQLNHYMRRSAQRVEPGCNSFGREPVYSCRRAGCTHTTGGRVLQTIGHNMQHIGHRAATFFAAGRSGRVECVRAGCNYAWGVSAVIPRRRLARPTRPTVRVDRNRRVTVTYRQVAHSNRIQIQTRRAGTNRWRTTTLRIPTAGANRDRNRRITGLTRNGRYQVRVRAGRVQRIDGRSRTAQSRFSAIRTFRVRPTPAPRASSGTPPTLSATANEVLRLVNYERVRAGLAPLLAANASIQSAANTRAREVSRQFSHTRPNGTPWSTVLGNNHQFRRAGENLAQGQHTPAQVVNAWMNSPQHRANILNPLFTHIGIGVYEQAWVQGSIPLRRMNWVQVFIG